MTSRNARPAGGDMRPAPTEADPTHGDPRSRCRTVRAGPTDGDLRSHGRRGHEIRAERTGAGRRWVRRGSPTHCREHLGRGVRPLKNRGLVVTGRLTPNSFGVRDPDRDSENPGKTAEIGHPRTDVRSSQQRSPTPPRRRSVRRGSLDTRRVTAVAGGRVGPFADGSWCDQSDQGASQSSSRRLGMFWKSAVL
jgi:hypothetical protein